MSFIGLLHSGYYPKNVGVLIRVHSATSNRLKGKQNGLKYGKTGAKE
jgi:hypothetical protein